MPLVNFKVEHSLKWDENCILSSKNGNSVFAITDIKLYVKKLLSKGFKRPIYWNQYQ